MLWYIDVLGYIFFKKFFIGVAAFLKWPSTPFIKKITTTHHIWFIPLALAILKVSKLNLILLNLYRSQIKQLFIHICYQFSHPGSLSF